MISVGMAVQASTNMKLQITKGSGRDEEYCSIDCCRYNVRGFLCKLLSMQHVTNRAICLNCATPKDAEAVHIFGVGGGRSCRCAAVTRNSQPRVFVKTDKRGY